MNDPVLEGWFTLDEADPHLIGSQCKACGSYYFPKLRGEVVFCRNPDCDSEEFDEVELSNTGTLWSYTSAEYQPPPPFVAKDPHEPYAIAAVELEREKMIVMGSVIDGVTPAELEVGMKMELALEELNDGKVTWKWKPA